MNVVLSIITVVAICWVVVPIAVYFSCKLGTYACLRAKYLFTHDTEMSDGQQEETRSKSSERPTVGKGAQDRV